MIKTKTKIFSVILILISFQVTGQDGSLDLSFGNNGILSLDLGSNFDHGASVAIQADGKIICGGTSKIGGDKNFALPRLHENGILDQSFGISGIATTDFNISIETLRAMAIRNDGKIISVGQGGNNIFDFAVTCHNSDGTLDTTFGNNGGVLTDIDSTLDYASAVVIQDDNKFLVAGGADYPGFDIEDDSDFAIVRYNQDGSLDIYFGTNGKVLTDLNNNSIDAIKVIELLPDGKIIAAGYADLNNGEEENFAVVKYHSDGSLDTSFGVNGIVLTDFNNKFDLPNDLAIQADGKIIIGGYSFLSPLTEFAIIRLTSNGDLDNSFGENGKQLVSFNSSLYNDATSVAIQADNKIVVSGFSYQGSYSSISMARLDVNGQIDSTFGVYGKVLTDFNSSSSSGDMVIQDDNKILLLGTTYNLLGDNANFALARYTVDLALNNFESNIRNNQLDVYPNPFLNDLNLNYYLEEKSLLTLYLVDNSGKTLNTCFSQKNQNAGQHNYKLATSNLESGIYYLVLFDNNDYYIKKIIK